MRLSVLVLFLVFGCAGALSAQETVPARARPRPHARRLSVLFVPRKGFTSDFPSNFRPIKGRIKWRVWLVSDTRSGI